MDNDLYSAGIKDSEVPENPAAVRVSHRIDADLNDSHRLEAFSQQAL